MAIGSVRMTTLLSCVLLLLLHPPYLLRELICIKSAAVARHHCRRYTGRLERLLAPREGPKIVHTSCYLPEAVLEALREAAFKERAKIHGIVTEGIRSSLIRLILSADEIARAAGTMEEPEGDQQQREGARQHDLVNRAVGAAVLAGISSAAIGNGADNANPRQCR
jgi:hypothetical protein